MFRSSISNTGTNYYTYKNAIDDIFNLTNKLVIEGLTKRHEYLDNTSIATKGVLLDDITQASVNYLRTKIDKFNVNNKALTRSRIVVQDTSLFVSNNIDTTNTTKRFDLRDRGNIEEGIVNNDNEELKLLRQRNIQIEGKEAKGNRLNNKDDSGLGVNLTSDANQ